MRPVIMATLMVLSSCSGGFNPLDYPGPESLMGVSETLFRRGKYSDAALGFRRLTLALPARDSIAVRARFLLAESTFAQGDYLEAARQFRRVADENPGHRLAPNAMLRAGDAQAALWKNPELDPTYGDAALQTYRELVARYTGSPAAQRANLKLQGLARKFAEKDYKNGVFYFRLKAYDSAILYFKSVVAQYGQSEYASESLVKLIDIYRRLGYDEERTEMCQHLGQFYPDADVDDSWCTASTGTP